MLRPIYENMPQELKDDPKWVNWKAIERNGKTTKPPFQPNGKFAESNNPATWSPFSAVKEVEPLFDGVGLVLTKEDDRVGVDFDKCRCPAFDGVDEEISRGLNMVLPEIADHLGKLNTYTEISPSGKGIRVFLKGKLPVDGKKRGNIEVYQSGRYVTVTGHILPEFPATICERQAELDAFYQTVFVDPTKKNAVPLKKGSQIATETLSSKETSPADKEKVRELILNSKQADLFAQLMQGDWDAQTIVSGKKYPSQSEADLALMGILAFYTGGNQALMKAMFIDSMLYRKKCEEKRGSDGETYLDKLVEKAIENCEEVYDPHYKKQGSTNEDLKSHINTLNEKHAILMMGGKCVVLNEIHDPVFNRPDVNFSSTQDFCTRYRNKKVTVLKNNRLVPVGIGQVWLDSSERREYEGIVFDPSRIIVPGYYNLFRGLAVKPKKGSWNFMKEHIFEIICDGKDEFFRYVIAWMARLVQDPGGKRPGVVIVLRGRQGTGKGCFVTNFGQIFGNHFLHIISYHLVAGRFNSHFKDALLVFVDEGFWGGDKKAEGALKGMVTEDHIEVEGKYKDPFRIKNNSNFIFASNNDWVIPAAFEERRFFVMNVLEKRMCDSHYFKRIYEEMDNGGREAMLHDLLHYDISNFDLRKFPRGEALFDQIVQSMPTVKKFWYELLRDGNICSLTEKSVMPSTTMWPTEYPSAQLYQIYLEFSSTLGDRYRSIDKQFGKHIKQLCPGIKKKKRGLERYYIFPTLSECRQQFEKLVNMKVDWGKDEDEAEDE